MPLGGRKRWEDEEELHAENQDLKLQLENVGANWLKSERMLAQVKHEADRLNTLLLESEIQRHKLMLRVEKPPLTIEYTELIQKPTITEEADSPKQPPSIEDPEKICQDLIKIDEELQRIDFQIDKSLRDLQQTKLDKSRAKILYKISQLYLSIGKYEKACGAATLAINLLKDPGPEEQESKKLLLLCLCCATEAVGYYEDAKNLSFDLPDATPDLENPIIAQSLQQLFDKFQLKETEAHGITRRIGPNGGVLELDDYTIYFPEGALPAYNLLHATTSGEDSVVPNETIQITPILRLNPNIRLNAAATVKLSTWLVTDDPTCVQIYYKATENAEWEAHNSPIRFYGSDRIECKITKFCEFCGVI